MKKMMKYLFVVLFAFAALFLSSCKRGGLGANPEKKIAEALEESLSDFKDPNSVTVVSISSSSLEGKMIKLTLSGKNTYGGTVSSDYYLVLEDFDCDNELFDQMFGDEKNEPFDGSSGNYDTWYDFHKSYYGPGGTYEYLYGMNFYEFSFSAGDLYQIHDDSDDTTLGEDMLRTIAVYTESDYSPDFNVGKINEYLNKYKEKMGWR